MAVRCVTIAYLCERLDIDDDVIAAARGLATAEERSLGSMISELARRGLTRARVVNDRDPPVIYVPGVFPAITAEMDRAGLGET